MAFSNKFLVFCKSLTWTQKMLLLKTFYFNFRSYAICAFTQRWQNKHYGINFSLANYFDFTVLAYIFINLFADLHQTTFLGCRSMQNILVTRVKNYISVLNEYKSSMSVTILELNKLQPGQFSILQVSYNYISSGRLIFRIRYWFCSSSIIRVELFGPQS